MTIDKRVIYFKVVFTGILKSDPEKKICRYRIELSMDCPYLSEDLSEDSDYEEVEDWIEDQAIDTFYTWADSAPETWAVINYLELEEFEFCWARVEV